MSGRRASRSELRASRSSSEFALAESDAGTGFLMSGRLDLNLTAGLGEGGFEGFSALEAGELLVFETFGFA